MNRRDIKKDIEYVIGEFLDDCALFSVLNPGKNVDKIWEIEEEAIALYNDLRNRINKPAVSVKKYDNKAQYAKETRAYYNTIAKDLFEKVDGLCEKLSEVIMEA